MVRKEYCQPNFETHFGFLENQLATSPDNGKYLAGTQFTAADILISYPLIIAQYVGVISQDKYPHLSGYVEHLRTLESYTLAVKKLEEAEGQPYKPF